MQTTDRDSVAAELRYARQRVSWAGEGRRRNSDWIEALQRVQAAADAAAESPSQAAELRLQAAIRAAEAEAAANAWQVAAGIVDCLTADGWARAVGVEDHWDDDIASLPGESLAAWADRHRGEEVWVKDAGEDGFAVSDDGTAVTVWAAVIPVVDPWENGAEPVVDTIPIDRLADWEPPEVEASPRDLALIGELREHELLRLARSADPDDRIAAACSPDATAEVMRAAGADVDVCSDGEIAVRIPRPGLPAWPVTIGHVDLDADADEIADQIGDLIPGATVQVRAVELDPDTGAVELVVDGQPTRRLGTIDLTGDEADLDAATDLVREQVDRWVHRQQWRGGRLIVDITVTV
jgi:hypothetical protein